VTKEKVSNQGNAESAQAPVIVDLGKEIEGDNTAMDVEAPHVGCVEQGRVSGIDAWERTVQQDSTSSGQKAKSSFGGGGSVSIVMSLVTLLMLVRRGFRVSGEIMFMAGMCKILVPLLLLYVILKSLDMPSSVYQICHLRVMRERERDNIVVVNAVKGVVTSK
jgi:hypothetical protein